VVTESNSGFEFSLKTEGVSATQPQSNGDKTTCRRSHLLRNNTILTSASNLFETNDFHSSSESSSRLTCGSCKQIVSVAILPFAQNLLTSANTWSNAEMGARKMMAFAATGSNQRLAAMKGCMSVITVFKVGCPCLSLISRTSDIVYFPFHPSKVPVRNSKCVFNNAKGLEACFQHISCEELSQYVDILHHVQTTYRWWVCISWPLCVVFHPDS
jgi:hypothetical protein